MKVYFIKEKKKAAQLCLGLLKAVCIPQWLQRMNAEIRALGLFA